MGTRVEGSHEGAGWHMGVRDGKGKGARVRYMVYGIWYMVYGIWYMVYGIWYTVYGIWHMVYGIWYMVYGIWYMVHMAESGCQG